MTHISVLLVGESAMLSTAVHCVMARASPAASHSSPQSLTFLQRASTAQRTPLLRHSRSHLSRPQSRPPQIRLLSTRRLYPHTQTRSPRTSTPSSPTQVTITTRTMASDSDYMAFLNKANAQREAGSGQQAHTESSQQQTRTKTVEPGTTVPSALKEVDAFYISETDEPFEPVVLKWEGAGQGKWPSSGIPQKQKIFELLYNF